MFLPNKYTNTYYRIITRAQSRDLPKGHYTERHHVIPRSLGGDNTKSNLAKLTAKEHYICHLLLTRMTEGKSKSKMHLALLKMCVVSSTHGAQRINISGAKYQRIREAAGRANSGVNSPTYGRKRPPEEEARRLATRKKNGVNIVHTAKSKAAIGASKKGKPRPDHVKAIMYENLKPFFGRDNNSGKHFYNDGTKNYLTYECPPGCKPGRVKHST